MRVHLFIGVCVVVCLGLLTGAQPQEDKQAKLDEKFQTMLTGAELIGHFTTDGADAEDSEPREEKYTIAAVTKLGRDLWKFECRIQYGENDFTVPIPLTVKWAGDTPVITLTDMRIAGSGPYTARVLFHDDKYAGTWSAGAGDDAHGGHLYGRIERAAE